RSLFVFSFFVFLVYSSFFTHPAPTASSTLSLHDALPIFVGPDLQLRLGVDDRVFAQHQVLVGLLGVDLLRILAHVDLAVEDRRRSEEHTSELQSRENLVCRLLLEKKKISARSIGYARTYQ